MLTLAAAVGSAELPAAIAQAKEQLQRNDTSSTTMALRERVYSLGSLLNESAGFLALKTSGSMMIQHQNPDLGMMSWEVALSGAPFLNKELERLTVLSNATERAQGVMELLSWQGINDVGYYDNLGVSGQQPHLLQGQGVATDPSFYGTSYTQFAVPGHGGFNSSKPPIRQSWNTAAEVMFDSAVQLHYSNLDPTVASWEVSVTWMAYMAEQDFGGGQPDVCHRQVKCTAEGHVVHGLVEKPFPMRVLGPFPVPTAATADGELTLSFQQDYPDSLGECSVRNKTAAGSYWCSTGDGRGNSVAEVWLRPVCWCRHSALLVVFRCVGSVEMVACDD